MKTRLVVTLNFRDTARQAMEFYQSVFGGKLTINTFKQYHASQDPSEDDKVMYAQLEGENGFDINAADVPNSMSYQPGTNFSLSLIGDNEAELRSFFDKLSAGGSDIMALDKSPWGDTFGAFTDKFGISWMVNISAKKE